MSQWFSLREKYSARNGTDYRTILQLQEFILTEAISGRIAGKSTVLDLLIYSGNAMNTPHDQLGHRTAAATSDSALGLERLSNRSSVDTRPTDGESASLGIRAAERVVLGDKPQQRRPDS
jgi:hypothetical protein